MLAVKRNQGRLYKDVRDLFEGAEEACLDGVPHEYATTLNKGHGRIERRKCRTAIRPAWSTWTLLGSGLGCGLWPRW